MRYVVTTDKRGYKRRFILRDEDGDELAERGIPAGPPELRELDLEAIFKEINNSLADSEIFTWDDVIKSQVGMSIVYAVFKRHIAGLFKEDRARLKNVKLD